MGDYIASKKTKHTIACQDQTVLTPMLEFGPFLAIALE